MKTWFRKTLSVGVLAAGAMLFGPGVAHADVHQGSHHNNGILNGTQIDAPVDVPINICGNALSLLGAADAKAMCTNGYGRRTGSAKQDSHHNNGILNGLQFAAPVHVPVNVCGNAFGFLGGTHAAAFCSNGHGGVNADHGHRHGHRGVHRDHGHRHGHGGVRRDRDNRHDHGGVNGDHGPRHGHGQDCGDAANKGGHGRNLGHGAAVGNGDHTKYGSNSRSIGGRSTAEPVEASPMSGLTQGVGAADLVDPGPVKILG